MPSIFVQCDVCGMRWTNIHDTVEDAWAFLAEHTLICNRHWVRQWQQRVRGPTKLPQGFPRGRTSATQDEGAT